MPCAMHYQPTSLIYHMRRFSWEQLVSPVEVLHRTFARGITGCRPFLLCPSVLDTFLARPTL